ncbi:FtsX-like permease family protein [Luteimicrobium album]|nr:ABC transporter permease [Luteimicrobium album]
MIRLTLAQMRRSVARLAAAGIAIAIGTGFVAATLVASDLIRTATTDSVAAPYARADLVVTADGEQLGAKDVADVAATPGVAAAAPRAMSWEDVAAHGKTLNSAFTGLPSDTRLEPQRVHDGAFPASDDEVALPVGQAERLGVEVGDTVTVTVTGAYDSQGAQPPAESRRLRVVGTLDDPYGAWTASGGAGIVTASTLRHWQDVEAGPGATVTYPAVLVALDAHASTAQASDALSALSLPDGARVLTRDALARELAAQATGDDDVFTYVVLTFAAIALVVAALVIANTFQVLVAQRARTLALLRCVGASKGQLGRSVVFEAGVLGLVGSAVGVVLGTGLAQLVLTVLRSRTTTPLPSSIDVSPVAVVVPLVVGTVVTIVASLAPARTATRVAPLAALRPAEAPTLTSRAGRVRGTLALLATVGGLLLLAVAVLAGTQGSPEIGLALGVLGGAVSFVGILVGSVFWMPRVVHAAGTALGKAGASSRLAAANTLRNPRRTTATSTALLIGVTLVAMMATGAASARVALGSTLDEHYPVDAIVTSYGSGDGPGEMTSALQSTLADVDGVRRVVPVSRANATLTSGGTSSGIELEGVEPAAGREVLRTPEALAGLDDREIAVNPASRDLGSTKLEDGDTVTLRAADDDGDPTGPSVRLQVRVVDLGDVGAYVTPAVFARVAPHVAPDTAWLAFADHADAADTLAAVQDAVADQDSSISVVGPAAQHADMEKVVDTILAIVLGLLAVAVVIALVGVANTLSLSVLERRRESATLRAIGLTRGQLRWMLAQEGMLIAGVGAVVGIVLGVAYGWAGAAAALGSFGSTPLVVPWSTIGVVLVVALVAGLAASALPGRSAARTSPVAALAVE